MTQVIRILFKHQAGFYSAIVTVIREFETDFIDIEFLDEDMIGIFNSSCVSYVEEEFKKMPLYQSMYLRSIMNSLYIIIKNAQHVSNIQGANILLDEEYVRQN